MARLTPVDKLLLFSLLPVWVLVFSLHVREVVRTGLAQPPVFAAPGGADAYPKVAGFRLETESGGTGLRLGDRLIRVGSIDLRGFGYLRFDAAVLSQAGRARRAPLVIERGGVRHEIVLRTVPHVVPWFRIPSILLMVVICVLALLRSPGTPAAQLLFLAWVGFSILQSVFYGGSFAQGVAAGLVWNLLGPVCVFLILRWSSSFPEELPRDARISVGWPWLMAALYAFVRFNYVFGFPLPPEIVPRLSIATHGLLLLVTVVILMRNYRNVDPVGRRRIKWVVYGAGFAAAPMMLTQLALLVYGDFGSFEEIFALSTLAGALAPLGILVAIARFNLFDIDRLIGATASSSIAIAALIGSVVAVAPRVAVWASGWSGLEPQTVQVLLSASLAFATVPFYRQLRPQIDRIFFPDRLAQERGIDRLLHDLASCRTAAEVLDFTGRRLHAVLKPDFCAVYAPDASSDRSRSEWRARFVRGREDVPALPAASGLLASLRREPAPHRLEALADRLDASARGALAELDASLVVPIRRGIDLAAFIVLGRRRSGDVYTATDLTLLGAVAENAAVELARLRDAKDLEFERVRAAELETLREAAESANLAKTRFLAAVSHDLRQPLHALGLFVDSLAERVGEGGARTTVQKIQASTSALGAMFDQLLDVSRLDARAIEPRVHDIALAPLLARLVSEHEPRAKEKHIALGAEVEETHVRTDPVLLARIVGNLLSNAVRYTERGSVELTARVRGPEVEVRVTDTGPGIAPERHGEIFEEFVQLESGEGQRGMGLGLSIVARMCELLGHELDFESSPDTGSSFTVHLPGGQAGSAPRPSPGVDLSGRRVLVVDDDLAILDGMAQVLGSWRCQAILAASVADSLESIERSAAPDAIVADFRLRGSANGLDAIDAVRAAVGREVPALVITGETGPDVLEAIRARGLVYLAKPVAPARLRATLVQLLQTPG